MLHSKIKAITKRNDNGLGFSRLQDLEKGIDWDGLVESIYPHYLKSKIKPTSLTVESILRIYILSRYFDMSPEGIEKALFQIDTLRDFALIDLDRDAIPNASCITGFISLCMEQNLATMIEQALRVKPRELEYVAAF